jgi:cytoskeletal protein RodZ
MAFHDSPERAPFRPHSTHLALGLPRIRKEAGISLETIAEATKISLRFLRAIEAEEFEKLPGGIFSKSYIKQYAAAIRFDESELLAFFDFKMNPQPQPGEEAGAQNANRSLIDKWLRMPAQAQH